MRSRVASGTVSIAIDARHSSTNASPSLPLYGRMNGHRPPSAAMRLRAGSGTDNVASTSPASGVGAEETDSFILLRRIVGTDGKRVPKGRKTIDEAKLDRIVADARRASEERNKGYREQALKM